MTSRVIKGSIAEHSEENAEEPVSERPQSLRMRNTSNSATVVEVTASGVVGDAAQRPGVEGVAQTLVAGASHEDSASFATLFGDGSESSESSGGVVVSLPKRQRGLGEHRGADEFPHAWHGEEDLRVAMLSCAGGRAVIFTELLVEFSDSTFGLTSLLESQLQSGKQGANVLGSSLETTRSQAQRRLCNDRVELGCGEASDSMLSEQLGELSFAKSPGLVRCGGDGEQRPQPRLVSRTI